MDPYETVLAQAEEWLRANEQDPGAPVLLVASLTLAVRNQREIVRQVVACAREANDAAMHAHRTGGVTRHG